MVAVAVVAVAVVAAAAITVGVNPVTVGVASVMGVVVMGLPAMTGMMALTSCKGGRSENGEEYCAKQSCDPKCRTAGNVI